MIIYIIIILFALLLAYIYYETSFAKENKVDLESKKIDGEIKITQISDYHSNNLKNTDYILEKIKDFSPDFIIMTGDINDYGVPKKFDRALSFVKKIMTLNIKTYYVIGNHEENGPMREEFLEELRKLNIKVLNNESDTLEIGKNKLYIYGTAFYKFDYKGYDGKNDYVNIVLAHHSKLVRDNLKGSEDFIFSGHTHGGQVRAPFIGALFAPGEGIFPKYDKGVFQFDNAKIYIDSGLGNTKMKLRFLNRIQFSNISLKSTNSSMVE